MNDVRRLAVTLSDVFAGAVPKVREVRQVLAVQRILDGEPVTTVCADLRLQRRGTEDLVHSVQERGLLAFGAHAEQPTELQFANRRLGIAQMLLGLLAERRFEELTAEITGGGILRIEDHRPSRTDTDYRLLNGQGSPICRLNIKFHGSLFRESQRFVGLDPADCFALATYKINNALKRQEQERLPYVFLVLSVPDLSAADVARIIPDDYVLALEVLGGRRAIEEPMVLRLLAEEYLARFRSILDRMPEGQFRLISAAKADKLLRERLFERVHALSLKSFTRKFKNAEVDMHFSLSRELTPIRTFLELLVQESPQRFAVRLYIGDY